MRCEKWEEIYEEGREYGLSKYVDEDFSWMQLDEILMGLKEGVDVSKYANKYLTVKQMSDIRQGTYIPEQTEVSVRIVNDMELEIYYMGRLIYQDKGWFNSFGTYIVRQLPIDMESGYFMRTSGKTYEEWIDLNEDWACSIFEENNINPNPELLMQLYKGLQDWDFIED